MDFTPSLMQFLFFLLAGFGWGLGIGFAAYLEALLKKT